MTTTESTDVLVVGSGFGARSPPTTWRYGGARVVVLERGPWLEGDDFDHDFKLGRPTRGSSTSWSGTA